MGKRSDFVRIERDFYRTPFAAAEPLKAFLPPGFRFYEPCAGDGFLTQHLAELGGQCVGQSDIEPQAGGITKADALNITSIDLKGAMVITNPPWGRRKKDGYIFHRMIEHFANLGETWFLADADWKHTAQAQEFIEKYLMRIVSIGRVKWIEGTSMTGKDNCCWYQFSHNARLFTHRPLFYGRGVSAI